MFNNSLFINKTEKLPKADIWCFGSPCTNISLAGNQKGLKGEQSGLFFEVMRILNETPEERKPAYLFMENVKNLISINGGRDFAKVLIEMDEAGYDVEWQVINSSWVIPQNRERIFVVGHKRGRQTRRVFPLTSMEIGSERKYGILKDVLEPVVDKKYNLSKEKLEQIKYFEKLSLNVRNINSIGNSSPSGYNKQNIFSEIGISPTLTAGLTKQPIRIATKINKIFDGRKYGLFGQVNEVLGENASNSLLIRRLTPRECWRLQGFTDKQFDKVKNAGLSDTQLYKQAGNAVTVPVIKKIAEKFEVL